MDKKLLWIILIVIALGVDSLAIDFMGPPTAGLKQGQLKIGYTYHRSDNDIKIKNIEIDGIDIGLGEEKIDDFKITRNYFTFNYGLASDRMEIYGFLGGADIEGKNFFDEGMNFSGSTDLAFGLGTKITTNKYDNSDWGILAQASWFRSDDTQSIAGVYDGYTYSGKVDSELDAFELQIAAGPTIKIMNDWKIYGGVLGYWLKGDLEGKLSATVDGESGSTKFCGDLKEDSAIGGYIGTQVELFKNAAIAAEYASTGDSWGFGANISWKF